MGPLELYGGLKCFTSGLLTVAGAETVYDTTVALNYMINGKSYVKAAVTDGATPTTEANSDGVPFPPLVGGGSVTGKTGNGCVVVWGVGTGGNVKCAMGPHVPLDVHGNFVNAPQFPPIPKLGTLFCPFAYQVIKAGATAAAAGFIFGVTNWNATGMTHVIQNVDTLPARPQVA